MELKTYQQLVMSDLRDYLDAVDRSQDIVAAWKNYWNEKDVAVAGNHPYRQRLNADFGGRVEVYEKDQLLNAQNFSPDTVREVLTVCVMSFSSLRIDSKKKDDRKVFQENGNLQRFAQEFDGAAELADTPDTALMNVLRQFMPVVVVDESHNAKSKLSVQMLQNLNPGFILDLTATPAANANIVSYVKALDLKKEHMVKLPVFVYNRADRTSVLQDAIQIRGRLENIAKAEERRGGRPIRFGEGRDLLSPENLTEGFSLAGADAHIDFSFSFDQAGSIDVEEGGDGLPKYKQLSSREREYITKIMAGQSADQKLERATELLYQLVNKFNDVKSSEIRPYVHRVLESLNKSDLDALDQVLPVVADRIREKIDGLKADHCFKKFKKGLDSSEIDCEPHYTLPGTIAPSHSTDILAKSLYGAEYADMSSLEEEAIKAIAGLDNVKWWHRIKDRKGFCLNGFINHYPDFMVMTHSGHLVLVETKGDYLDNTDSKRKLELGRAWQNATNSHFKYFMVFKDRDVPLEGAYQLGEFLEVLKGL